MAGKSFSSMCLMLALAAAGADVAEDCSGTGSCQNTQSHALLQTAKTKHVDATKSDVQDVEAFSQSRKHSSEEHAVISEHTIQQKSSQYYMDAWPAGWHDASVANRKAQGDDSQVWIVTEADPSLGEYTIQQKSTGRYMDAWPDWGHDYNVVTREAQGDSSQLWIITPKAGGEEGEYSIKQKATSMNLDAWETAAKDYSVVMRSYEDTDDTQTWVFTPPLEEPRCLSFCNKKGDLNPDHKKCTWMKCRACPECEKTADQPRCMSFCNEDGDLNPDHEKCGWTKCSACAECS